MMMMMIIITIYNNNTVIITMIINLNFSLEILAKCDLLVDSAGERKISEV